MKSHTYHRNCGCYHCGRHERALERDAELRDAAAAELSCYPALVAEVAVNEGEAAGIAAALRAGDLQAVGRVYAAAVSRFVDELIEERAERLDILPGEAASQLCDLYRPEPARAAA